MGEIGKIYWNYMFKIRINLYIKYRGGKVEIFNRKNNKLFFC